MNIKNSRISSTQLEFLIIGLIECESLTAAFISGITKQNTWVVWLVAFLIVLLMILVYTSLSERFPRKSLIQINDLIYGRYFGKIISALYIYYFGYIVAANFRYIADFFSTYIFPQTSVDIFIIAVAVVSMYAVKKGLEVIARSATVIAIIAVIVDIIITLFTLKHFSFSNFLPMFQMNLKEFIQGVNLMIAIPIGEVIVFFTIFPYVNKIEQIKRSTFSAFIIGNLLFLSIILRNTFVLGSLDSIHVLPSYQVARIIDIGRIITRMEVLIAIVLLFNEFLKISIFYYTTVSLLAQFFKLKSYKSLVIPFGIISVVFSIIMFDSTTENVYYASSIYPIYAIPFIIIIPIISLIIASIKERNS